MTSFDISNEEWQAAHDAIAATDPNETEATHGVALVASGGRRRWLAWSDELTVETTACATDDDVELVMPISRRLITFALPLSHLGDVTLTIGADHATVHNTHASSRVDHPAVEVPGPAWGTGPAATARLSVHALSGLFTVGRLLPAGVDLDQIISPSFEMSITPVGVTADIDWSAAGVSSTHLEMTADTFGVATRVVWSPGAARLLTAADQDARVEVLMPASGDVVVIRTEHWSAAIPAFNDAIAMAFTAGIPTESIEDYRRPALFDTSPFGAGFVDPFLGWSLTDLRALAIDPDPSIRLAATASRWNWDVRLQRVLATDPDGRVVLALLDQVDPYLEVCELIIDGPHVEARRELAGRNVRGELLERLAADDDPVTSVYATATLARRANLVIETYEASR